MRLAVLPRDDAARVITSATARSAWAVNVANLALTLPILIEFFVSRGLVGSLWEPLVIVLILLGLAVTASLRPKPWVVVTFLIAGAIGAFTYQLALIAAVPDIENEALFLLNRPAVSLVLVAVGATTWLVGLAWVLAGFLVSVTVSLAVAWASASAPRAGWGPVLVLVMYVLAFAVLAAIQARARRRTPNFEALEEETRRLEVEENLRARVTAAVHDTLLNDLSIIMNSPDRLEPRVVDRLRQDLETLTSAQWLRESSAVAVDDQDSALRNQLMMIMSDLQWRGLTVHITGSGTGIYRLAPAVATALIDAVRACLENVLRHSGASLAEVDLAYADDEVTVIVTDEGVGFDSDAVPGDRLGLRHSVVDRIQAVGGSVRIWSSAGAGTSIVIRVPVLEVVTRNEESAHGAN
ncbi:MAG: sensor histidine kinase [Rhodoglobus sp.]